MKKHFILRTESLLASKTLLWGLVWWQYYCYPFMAIFAESLSVLTKAPWKEKFGKLADWVHWQHPAEGFAFWKKALNRVPAAVCELWITVLFLRRLQTLRTFSAWPQSLSGFAKTWWQEWEKLFWFPKPEHSVEGQSAGHYHELFKDEIFPKPCDQYTRKSWNPYSGQALDRLFTDENGVPVEEVQQYENYEVGGKPSLLW